MLTALESGEMLLSTLIMLLGVCMLRFGRPRILRGSYLAQLAAPERFIKATGLVLAVLAALAEVFLAVHHYLPGLAPYFDPVYYILTLIVVMNLLHYSKEQKQMKKYMDSKKDRKEQS